MTDLVQRGVPDPAVSLAFTLQAKYTATEGLVHVSGLQAVVRGLVDSLRSDHARGLRTAAFVSGYQGSPLGGFDREVDGAIAAATDVELRLQRGVNEELAATAVMGTQLASTVAGPYDGVIGLWFGKGPGIDRSVDAFRHAAFAGTSRWGGAVALVGDDPQAKSSTIPSASEGIMADLAMPVLVPADLDDARWMVPYAVAMSRATGGWVGIKIVTAVADGAGTIELRPVPAWDPPADSHRGTVTGHLLTPLTVEREPMVMHERLVEAARFASLHPVDRVEVSVPTGMAKVTLAAAGVTYLALREALDRLGLTSVRCAELGVRVVRLALVHPLADATIEMLTDEVSEVILFEERRNLVERQLLERLRHRGPVITGWRDGGGEDFVPSSIGLTSAVLVPLLQQRLTALFGADSIGAPARRLIPVQVGPGLKRPAWFCPGCPHSTSTQVPPGSLVGGGIGCHSIALGMPADRVGEIISMTQMGGEGSQWIGMAPFVDTPHMFQNLGDGTFFHSGQLSIRAAVAADVNLTFKLLYNGHVAMTGGQKVIGQQTIPTLVNTLMAEGVARVVITTDQPKGYARRHRLPAGIEVRPRSEILEVQKELAATRGVTVLIHDQLCATEVRRGRTRGLIASPKEQVVIDERVCEGCGDCQRISNCLALSAVATVFGPKTAVDQSACTFDQRCVEGDCPSFTMVRKPRKAAKRAALASRELPEPSARPGRAVIRCTGIGGNGVLTVAHLIGTTALLDGLRVRGLDQTGMAQKGGGVVSDVIITSADEHLPNTAGAEALDVLIAADLVVALGVAVVDTISSEHTTVVGALEVPLTGDQLQDQAQERPTPAQLKGRLDELTDAPRNVWIDIAEVRRRLTLSNASSNLVLLGAAYQRGLLPVRATSIERAVELNAVAVDANLAAFRAGRLLVVNNGELDQVVAPPPRASMEDEGRLSAARSMVAARSLPEQSCAYLTLLTAELLAYQGPRLAGRFLDLVAEVHARTADGADGADGAGAVEAVAFGFHKLLAYKDEYEVARLLTRPGRPAGRTTYVLHPPILRAVGVKGKIRLGPWAKPGLKVLASMRFLRGKWIDPFGHAEVRRVERALPDEFEQAVRSRLDAEVVDASMLTRLGRLPDAVRGYESIKLDSVQRYRAALAAFAPGGH